MDIQLYQPSNGTEMDYFCSRFCFKCLKMPVSHDAKNQCKILGDVLCCNMEDKEYPNQWRYLKGKPVCTAFIDREEENLKRRESRKPQKDNKTLSLF